MARVGMSDQDMATFIKETFCVDSTFKASDLFDAAELPPSWQSVCAALGLNPARGLELQNALLRAKRDATGKGAKQQKSTPDELPTDESGRPLVHGKSILNGICRDAEGAAPKGADGKAKAPPPMFSFSDMMKNAPRLNKAKEPPPPPPPPEFNLEVKEPKVGWGFRPDMVATAANDFELGREFLGCATLKPGEQPVAGKPRGAFKLTKTHVKFNVPAWRSTELVALGLSLESISRKFANNRLSYLAEVGKTARKVQARAVADAKTGALNAEAATLLTPLAVREMHDTKPAALKQESEQHALEHSGSPPARSRAQRQPPARSRAQRRRWHPKDGVVTRPFLGRTCSD